HLPPTCAIDGEIVVRSGEPGAQRLDWEALSQRIHPAASQITRLAEETPAELVAFDLLALGETGYVDQPLHVRRAALEALLAGLDPAAPIHMTRITDDAARAEKWFSRFEGAGLD